MGLFDFFRKTPLPPTRPPVTPASPPPTPSDSNHRAALLTGIGDINDFSRPRPLVTLAEFFEGNNDYGSIGYNLPDPASPQQWYAFLKTLAARPEILDIRIQINDLADPDGWPSSDTIWLITTASKEQVHSWIPEQFKPDDIYTNMTDETRPLEPYALPPSATALGLWYD